MKLTFYGGCGEATGANYILESGGTKIMIDCGLHQGSHYAERENFEPFAYDPTQSRRFSSPTRTSTTSAACPRS